METVELILARLAEELEVAKTPQHKRKVHEHAQNFKFIQQVREKVLLRSQKKQADNAPAKT